MLLPSLAQQQPLQPLCLMKQEKEEEQEVAVEGVEPSCTWVYSTASVWCMICRRYGLRFMGGWLHLSICLQAHASLPACCLVGCWRVAH
jgi:hypothetical protein